MDRPKFLRPKKQGLTNLQKLMQFAYAIGWSMTELMQYAEGNEDPYEAISRKKKRTSNNTAKRLNH